MLSANEVANVFNQQNDKASWRAVCTGELVHFTSTNGMVALVYDAAAGTFAVKFNKFQGAFGDYVQAIRKGLFSILNTLKSGGLPFEGPPTVDDMTVLIRAASADDITCEWDTPAVYKHTELSITIGGDGTNALPPII